jgi:hypothetical protein
MHHLNPEPKDLHRHKGDIFVYFHMDGCPYCVRFDPIWNDCQEKIAKSGIDVKCVKVEMRRLNEYKAVPSLSMAASSVDGFPTIAYIPSHLQGNYIPLQRGPIEGSPKPALTLLEWVKSVASPKPKHPTKTQPSKQSSPKKPTTKTQPAKKPVSVKKPKKAKAKVQ